MPDLDRKPIKKGIRRLQRALDTVLDLVGASSRSPSPSPVVTPVREGAQTGSRTAAPPPPSSKSPAVASSSAPPRSPGPWEPPAPFTAAPPGPLEQIRPSASSGRYHVIGPQAPPSPSIYVGGHLAVPEPLYRTASPTLTTSRENQVDEGTDAPLSLVEIRRLLEVVVASENPAAAVDRQTWARMYRSLVGRCLFASAGPGVPPPNVPGPSTSVARYTAHVSCIHERHVELALPCTDPIPIPVEVNLSDLLLRLETLQETRAVDLLSAIARVVVDEDPSGAALLSFPPEAGSTEVSGLDSEGGSSSGWKGKGRAVVQDAGDDDNEQGDQE